MEMSLDLKNPSPIRTSNASGNHLESYMRNQSNANCFKAASPNRQSRQNNQSTLNSMHNNYEAGSNAIDVTTARFMYNNLNGTSKLTHNNQSEGISLARNISSQYSRDNPGRASNDIQSGRYIHSKGISGRIVLSGDGQLVEEEEEEQSVSSST